MKMVASSECRYLIMLLTIARFPRGGCSLRARRAVHRVASAEYPKVELCRHCDRRRKLVRQIGDGILSSSKAIKPKLLQAKRET